MLSSARSTTTRSGGNSFASVIGVSAEEADSDSATRVLREGAILRRLLRTPTTLLAVPQLEGTGQSTIEGQEKAYG
jgi:hypothetical protein